jgi:L-threonylcarbamoyladenylate synthase
LIVHVASIEQAQELVQQMPKQALVLARKFWPGPLTLLLPKTDKIPDIVTSGMPDVAIRIPKNPLTLELLEALDFPLVAPSANPFGYISPTTAAHVNDQLGDAVSYILDGGPCSVGVESTIVGFPETRPTIYRKGGLPLEEIEALIGPVLVNEHSSSNPQAPGMLKSHYAPKTRILLGDIKDMMRDTSYTRIGILSFKNIPLVNRHSNVVQFALSEDGDLNEAAKNLFSYLRKLDSMNLDIILAEPVPDQGLGRAINDRLRRAAAE